MEQLIVEYEILRHPDTPLGIIVDAAANGPVEMVLVGPDGREHKVTLKPLRAYPAAFTA